MSDKTKRRIAIAGASIIGLALVVAIGMQFAKEPVKPDASSQEPSNSSDVSPEIQHNTEEKEVVVSPQTTPEPESSETLPPQTDLPEQKLQPDPVKPEDTEKKSAAESKPQNDGELPGFDNVPDGGTNQVINADDMYENGNKIGDMD